MWLFVFFMQIDTLRIDISLFISACLIVLFDSIECAIDHSISNRFPNCSVCFPFVRDFCCKLILFA